MKKKPNFHLTGYEPSGKRINRRYVSYDHMKRQMNKMSIVNCRILFVIPAKSLTNIMRGS